MTPLATLELAIEVLKEVEWCSGYWSEPKCPVCKGNNPPKDVYTVGTNWRIGHSPDCKLSLALIELDSLKQTMVLESPSGGGDVSSKPSQDHRAQQSPADTEGCGSTNVKLLRDLCEVDTRWALIDPAYATWQDADHAFSVWIMEDESIEGGAALWWMLQEMRGRWWDDDCENGFLPDQEMASLQKINECKVSNLTPRTVLTAYIAWRKSTLPTPERSEGSASHNGTSAIRSSDGADSEGLEQAACTDHNNEGAKDDRGEK